VKETVIYATRAGDWLPPEELHGAALSAVTTEGNLTINLGGVDHLDGASLQILLALATERKRLGGTLTLAETSTQLSCWFEYAGERGNISPDFEA
jgi:anti-anti-sigma regulatory factor